MARKRFTTEQIIHKLRLAEVEIARGKLIPEACRQIGVTEQTFYRWRKAYGGLKLDQAKHFKSLDPPSNIARLLRCWSSHPASTNRRA